MGNLIWKFDELKMALNCQPKYWMLGINHRKFNLKEFT